MSDAIVQAATDAALRAARQGARAWLRNAVAPVRTDGPAEARIADPRGLEGMALPFVVGRWRVTGLPIWVDSPRHHVTRRPASKTAPRTERRRVTLSLALGLACSPVARIERVLADGVPLSPAPPGLRLHGGGPAPDPDPLLEALMGTEAPLFPGTAWVMIEDFDLTPWDGRVPLLTFDIVCPPGEEASFEAALRGVCVIPATGEAAYATTPVLRVEGPGREVAQNVHAEAGRADLTVSLDQLAADLPQVRAVSLTVAWMADGLDPATLSIRPGVEARVRETVPRPWRAGDMDRAGAHLISVDAHGPVYGGTPADADVIAAIADLKARGHEVVLTPFLLVDAPGLPWRGRIAPAGGDGAHVPAAVAQFFGTARADHFTLSGGRVRWTGPTSDHGWRRCVLHMAWLARAAGGVDGIVIGSEFEGLTRARDASGAFPAVQALRALAAEVRAVVGPDTAITYAADWSGWNGMQPGGQASGQPAAFIFHLDPLWADPNIDAVGIDWYVPVTHGTGGGRITDAAIAAGIAGGEGHDWYFATQADRLAGIGTPITDSAHAEPWIWRVKDIASWWSNRHHDRPGGVRSALPTAWTPGMKPVWFCEAGFAAIDRATHAPHLFASARSTEGAIPPHSSGLPDPDIQRRALTALLARVGTGPLGPVDRDRVFAWCWDARPFPAFPGRADIWADAPDWSRGHWLNGRAGQSDLARVLAALAARVGIAADLRGVTGAVAGMALHTESAAQALEALALAHDLVCHEAGGRLVIAPRAALAAGDGVIDPERVGAHAAAAITGTVPGSVRVRAADAAAPGAMLAVQVRAAAPGTGAQGATVLDLPALPLRLGRTEAEALGRRVLARLGQTLVLALPAWAGVPAPGEAVRLGAGGAALLVVSVRTGAEGHRLTLVEDTPAAPPPAQLPVPATMPIQPPRPEIVVLDLPAWSAARAGLFARPFVAPATVAIEGADGVHAHALAEPLTRGHLLWSLWPGPHGRLDRGNRIEVALDAGWLGRVDADRAAAGANRFAVESAPGVWEVFAALRVEPVSAGVVALSLLLRGLEGTMPARPFAPAGSRLIVLDGDAPLVDLPASPARVSAHLPGGAPGTLDWGGAVHAGRLPAPVDVRALQTPEGGWQITWAPARHDAPDLADALLPDAVVIPVRVSVMAGARTLAVTRVEATVWSAAHQAVSAWRSAGADAVLLAQLDAGGRAGAPARIAVH